MQVEGSKLLPITESSGSAAVGSSTPSLRWDAALFFSVVVFPLLYTFQPSQSFLVTYLVDVLGLTNDEVKLQVLPAWTYSFLCFTLLFALLSQIKGKWCVVAGMAGACITLIVITLLPLRAWHVQLQLTVATEVTQGLYSAGEVVYSSLLYRLVPLSVHFQHVASISRAMRLFGVLSSSLLAQLLLFLKVELIVLYYISLGCLSAALIMAIALKFDYKKSLVVTPRRGSDSIAINEAFVPNIEATDAPKETQDETASLLANQSDNSSAAGSESRCSSVWSGVVAAVRESWALYHLEPVQQLSMFLFVSNGVHPLVLTYWQSLFRDVDASLSYYNAFLFAACNALAFVCALLPMAMPDARRLRWVQPVIAVSPVLSCALLVIMSNYGSFEGSTVWPSFAGFLAYHALYEAVLVVANASLATHLKRAQKERYGVLFCVSFSGSLVLQTLLQLGLQQSSLSIRAYFVVFGGVYLVVPLVMAAIHGLHVLIARRSTKI